MEERKTSLHATLKAELEKQGIEKGYVIGKPSFRIPGRANVIVDVCWDKGEEKVLWEVELKARYEEKLFHFHLLKENYSTLKFGLVVQRPDSKKQVLRISDKLLSQNEKDSLTIQTVNELTGRSVEELPKLVPELFWTHRASPKMCVALFAPCAFDDGFNRGIRLTGIYLREKGYSMSEIADYIEWLAGQLGLPLFETRSALDQIQKGAFPSCNQIQQTKTERGPHILRLGDLDIAKVCKHCEHYERT
jgi:hypothetical protein